MRGREYSLEVNKEPFRVGMKTLGAILGGGGRCGL